MYRAVASRHCHGSHDGRLCSRFSGVGDCVSAGPLRSKTMTPLVSSSASLSHTDEGCGWAHTHSFGARAETKKAREPQKNEKTRGGLRSGSYVLVDFVFDRGLLSISIKNIGSRPAFGVRVEFSHRLMGVDGTLEVSALPL